MASHSLKPQVLVVDDNVANRAAFSALLEEDYAVTVAESGAWAIEISQKEDFAVILLDVRMPVMDGFETAEALRMRERTRYTPIIFMSAFEHSVARLKKGYLAGATEFLASPVDGDLLLFKVGAYARLHLRNESMKRQIRHLNSLVENLQVDAPAQSTPRETTLKNKIRELEATIARLEREISMTPE